MHSRKLHLSTEYAAVLKEKNLHALCVLTEALRKQVDDSFSIPGISDRLNLAIAATGSDGRLEKAHLSKTELLFIVNSGAERARAIISGIQSRLTEVKCSCNNVVIKIDTTIEVKPSNGILSYAFGSPDRAFPNRILDAHFLLGNPSILPLARIKLLKEWTGPEGRRIKDRVNSRVKEYQGITKTGRNNIHGNEMVHFDLDKGEFYYSNPESGPVAI